MKYQDIDFGAIYRAAMSATKGPKPASEWNSRSSSKRGGHMAGSQQYVELFMARMDLTGAASLLDVGCGQGALALPLARKLAEVHALDYSEGMLARLAEQRDRQGQTNVRTWLRAWEDDWADIPRCDIAIASRSTLVADLQPALQKLNDHARLRAYLSYPVSSFVDAEILRLAGIAQEPLPDYMLVLNLLRSMGAQPELSYIDTPGRMAGCASFEEFLERLAWPFGTPAPEAVAALRHWYDADPARASQGGAPMRWAFVSWQPV